MEASEPPENDIKAQYVCVCLHKMCVLPIVRGRGTAAKVAEIPSNKQLSVFEEFLFILI